MRLLAFISICCLPFSALASGLTLSPDSARVSIADHPQALQKAGVKKVRCIFKDSRKFIWIGTENGLYRYDGTNVDLLQHDPADPHSLPDNVVVSITEDRKGRIWVGTLQGAANVDPWSFNCKIFNRRKHNLDQDYDVKIYADPKGSVWAGGSRGLDRFDEHTGMFRKFWQASPKDNSGAGYVSCVTEWKKDTLVLGTFNGAILVRKNGNGYRQILNGNHVTVTRVLAAPDGRLWLGTWSYGCFVSDQQGTHFDKVQFETGQSGELANVITGIVSTSYGHEKVLWIATLRGVYKLTSYTANLSFPTGLHITSIWKGHTDYIMADDDQYIWEAGATVSRFFAGQSFFTPVNINYSGSVQDVQPLTLKGAPVIATLSWYAPSGMLASDLSGRTIYKQQPSTPDDANVSAIARDKYHRLWVSSLAGVTVMNENFKPVFRLNDVPFAADKLSSAKTNHLIINRDTVWVACYKKAVDLYDLNFHKIKTFSPGDASGLTDDYIERFFTDSRGHVWLCGNNKLYEYAGRDKKLRILNLNKDSTAFTVNGMAELPGGDLVIGSESGLFRLNPKTYAFSKINSPLIDNNRIIAVAVDGNGDVWFINSEHLVWYQVKMHHFTLFGKDDGLRTDGDLQWLGMVDHKHCFLAAHNQVVSFTPGADVNPSPPVKLYFHDVAVNDSMVARKKFGNTLSLNYDENRLNVGFGAINYVKPEQTLYACQLTGVDDKWVYTQRNFASYANLAPGTYTLRLKAANYAGLWSPPISMKVIVQPPFWATWWFMLLSVLLIGSLLFIAIRYVLQRNLRERILRLEKEQAVEKERNRIARDMHDDLGSGLTKIAILSEVAKTQMDSPAYASANLDVISAASRELVDNLQDIIWVLNPQNDSLNSLILYIKEYAESFFESAGLHCEFRYEDNGFNILLSEEQRRNIFLAVKESCNNILKHAACTLTRIYLEFDKGVLIIRISDNGRGFDPRAVGNFSNGLQNIRNRMEQIDASSRIISTKNKGTTVELLIPV